MDSRPQIPEKNLRRLKADLPAGTRPTISIALATYNGAAYLREQLDSIYAPCGVVFEVVVSDDGSTDGTREILADYVHRRGLRNVSDGRRRGLVQNFAHALAHCRGELIALADQDDIWQPGRLDFLCAQLGGADAAYSMLEQVLKPDGSIARWHHFAGIEEFLARHGNGKPTRHLIASNWVVSHTMLLRRQAVERALPIPEAQPYHDSWLALAASAGAGLKHVTPNLTLYRLHAASHTASAPPPPGRAVGGVSTGLARESWLSKCRAEIARLDSCAAAPFLAAEDRAFAGELRRYYERGLRRGVSFSTAFSARRWVRYFQFSCDPGFRRRFILRGLLGAI